MSEDLETIRHQASVQRMMRRLNVFARGLRLSETATRRIVEQVAVDLAIQADEERLVEARARMILEAVMDLGGSDAQMGGDEPCPPAVSVRRFR